LNNVQYKNSYSLQTIQNRFQLLTVRGAPEAGVIPVFLTVAPALNLHLQGNENLIRDSSKFIKYRILPEELLQPDTKAGLSDQINSAFLKRINEIITSAFHGFFLYIYYLY
jgi:hypothetical protein